VADQDQIRKLLDDPNVDGDTKKTLVWGLLKAGAPYDQVQKYADANGIHVLDQDNWMGRPLAESIKDNMPQDQVDAAVNKASQQVEVANGQKTLNETGDFSTSDQLLDAGSGGLRFFENFIPFYNPAAQLTGSGGQAPDLQNDICRNYDEVRGIDLGAFRADAGKINDAVSKMDTAHNELGRDWTALSGWQGDAANAANAYNGQFLGVAGGFVNDSKAAPGTITAAATNIQKQVKDFAQHVHDLYAEQCGGQTTADLTTNIRKAGGNITDDDLSAGDYLSGIPSLFKGEFIGIVLGGPIGGIIGGFVGWTNYAKQLRQQIIDDAKQKLTQFLNEFDQKKQTFDQYCQSVQQGIQSDYDTMLQTLDGQLKDKPFGQLGDPKPFTGSQGTKPSGDQGNDTGNPGNTPPPGVGGGGDTGGGGGDTGGGGGGGDTGGGAPPPTGPSGNPGTPPPDLGQGGKGDPTHPPQPPTDPSGGGGKPETVTIKDGDHQIAVDSPDGRGHVKITVTSGDGTPKTYDVDFGNGTGTGAGTGTGTGAGGGDLGSGHLNYPAGGGGDLGFNHLGGAQQPGHVQPGHMEPVFAQQPGHLALDPTTGQPIAGPTGHPPISGPLPVDPTTGQPLPGHNPIGGPVPVDPTGQPGTGASGAIPVHAGPDGHAVIHDGNTTITVDTDPRTGEVKLSVADGAGKPETYDINFEDKTGASGANPGLPHTPVNTLIDQRGPGFGPGSGGYVGYGQDQGGYPGYGPGYGSGGGEGYPAGFPGPAPEHGGHFNHPGYAAEPGFGPQHAGGFGAEPLTGTNPAAADPGFTAPAAADPGRPADLGVPAGQADPGGNPGPPPERPVWTQPAAAAPPSFAPGYDPGFAAPAHAEPAGFQHVEHAEQVQSTTASSASFGGGTPGGGSIWGGSGTSGGDSLWGQVAHDAGGAHHAGGAPSSDGMWGGQLGEHHDQGSQPGLADTHAQHVGDTGSPTLGSTQDASHPAQQGGSPMGGGMMGGGMMGGGMAGGHGGGGGDQERGASQWRTSGKLFDEDANVKKVRDVLGDDR
jgi:hypothetical protein